VIKKHKKEKKAALILTIVTLMIGVLSILGFDKNSLTGMAMVKIVQYTGNPVALFLVGTGLMLIIILIYIYLFMRSW
jgi:hypothetical protein